MKTIVNQLSGESGSNRTPDPRRLREVGGRPRASVGPVPGSKVARDGHFESDRESFRRQEGSSPDLGRIHG